MSERLYYTDAYTTEFEAHITAMTTVNGRPAIVLDQSYFYPTSGGQSYDTGTVGGKTVIDVMVGEQGQVFHILADALPEAMIGEKVQGKLDWSRRYDHMQQHAGQHLLSQLFFQHYHFETVAVHFGDTESTLDLETPEITPTQIEEVEAHAMELVYHALPIKAYFVSQTELSTIPLRRPPKVSGTVRIVEIDGFDYSACGGTHCRTTAEIGPIKVTKAERRRGQVRITFVCGNRAWLDYQCKHQLLTSAANLFSNEMTQVPVLIERNLGQLKELARQMETLQTELVAIEAAQLLTTATPMSGYQVVQRTFADKEVNTVKRLANQLQQQPGVLCLFSIVQAEKVTVLFARAADVNLHVGNLLRDGLRAIGGKGGGKEDFAQGGGITLQQSEEMMTMTTTWLAATKC